MKKSISWRPNQKPCHQSIKYPGRVHLKAEQPIQVSGDKTTLIGRVRFGPQTIFKGGQWAQVSRQNKNNGDQHHGGMNDAEFSPSQRHQRPQNNG